MRVGGGIGGGGCMLFSVGLISVGIDGDVDGDRDGYRKRIGMGIRGGWIVSERG